MERATSVKHTPRARRVVTRKNTVSALPLGELRRGASNVGRSGKKRKASERKTPRTPRTDADAKKAALPTPTSAREAARFSLAFEVNEAPAFLQSDTKPDTPKGPHSMRASEMIEHAFSNNEIAWMPNTPIAICMSLQLRNAVRRQETNGMTHAVLITKIPPASGNSKIVYQHVPLDAVSDETRGEFLEALFGAVEFVAEVKQRGGKVCIACRNGRMLSATVALAWIMRDRECSFDAAYAAVCGYKPDIALTAELIMALRFYEWHAVRLGQRTLPRDMERYYAGWRNTADGVRAANSTDQQVSSEQGAAAAHSGAAAASVAAQAQGELTKLKEQLARESKRRAQAEKESKKAKKKIDELRSATQLIVSETESMLEQQRSMEDATLENEQLRARVAELEELVVEQKREQMASLGTLLHETERLEETIDALTDQLKERDAQLDALRQARGALPAGGGKTRKLDAAPSDDTWGTIIDGRVKTLE